MCKYNQIIMENKNLPFDLKNKNCAKKNHQQQIKTRRENEMLFCRYKFKYRKRILMDKLQTIRMIHLNLPARIPSTYVTPIFYAQITYTHTHALMHFIMV